MLDDLSKSAEAAGHLGRITSIDDLPPKKELIRLARQRRLRSFARDAGGLDRRIERQKGRR